MAHAGCRYDNTTKSQPDCSIARRRLPVTRRTSGIRGQLIEEVVQGLDEWINRIGPASIRDIADAAKIPESTLRYLLERRHKRVPYVVTLNRILELNLPEDLRNKLLDVRDFKTRVVARYLLRPTR